MRPPPPTTAGLLHPYEWSRGPQDDHDDQGGPQNKKEKMAQLQAPRALALCHRQIPHRGKIELGRNSTLQQMEQRRNRRRGESQQCQRMDETHDRRRNAMPKGMSVCT